MVFGFHRSRNRENQETFYSRTVKTAKDYASNTTIHGFAYIANHEHSIAARLLWLGVVVLAVGIASFQLISLRIQWQKNPVITNLETVALPIEQIEFPAVTICPQGSVKKIMDYVLFEQLAIYIMNKSRDGQTGVEFELILDYIIRFLASNIFRIFRGTVPYNKTGHFNISN